MPDTWTNNNYIGTTTEQKVAETSADPQGGKPQKTYVEIIREMMPEWDPEKMKAEIAADKKRQKRQAIFAAIGDGVAALSNLYAASAGAPSMYDASKGMTAAHTAYWDKVKADREKNRQQYLNAFLTAAGMDDNERHRSWTRTNTEKEQALQADLREREQTRKEAWDAWRAKAQQLALEIRQAQDTGRKELAERKIEELERHNRAMESLGYYRADHAGEGKKRTLTMYGKTTSYENANEYNKAVYAEADKLKIPTYGMKVDEIAAEVEKKTSVDNQPRTTANLK